MSKGNNRTMLAAWSSLVSNVLLTVLKISVGLLFNSEVLIADGLHNAGDVIASFAAIGSMRISSQPADEEHPYGHGKAEVLGAGAVSIVLILASIYIGIESVMALFHPPSAAHWLPFYAAIVSLVWKAVLYVYTIRIGRKTNSKSLIATANDHLADVYASTAAVLGIGLSLFGDYQHIHWLAYGDPIAGIIVAILVLKLAIEMGKETIDVLMEKSVPTEKINLYLKLIETVQSVKRIDRIRARELGHYVLVDVRVSVPAELTIQQGHDISRALKQLIMKECPDVEEVLVHLNPWYSESSLHDRNA